MKRAVVLALIFGGLLAACGALLTPIPVTHLASLIYGPQFPSATTSVVRDQSSWQTLWTEMTRSFSPPAPPLPAVDFSKNMVLVASPGESTGLSIAITAAAQSSSGEIVVDVTITHPGRGCAVPQVITSPVDIATIPRSDANVVFKTTNKDHNCE